jgi:hypothetical protein
VARGAVVLVARGAVVFVGADALVAVAAGPVVAVARSSVVAVAAGCVGESPPQPQTSVRVSSSARSAGLRLILRFNNMSPLH